MVITLLGKVLGLVRDRLLAVNYGTGMEANAFYTASRIPRVFFDAVFASAIAACFIPVFSGYLTKEGKEKAMRFAGTFLTVMAVLKRLNFLSTTGVSVAGAITHNVGQILVAMWLMNTTAVGYYLIVLAVTGTIAGVFIGLCGALLIRRIPNKW